MDKMEKIGKEKTESTRRIEIDQKKDCKRKSVSIADKLNEKRKEQLEKVRTMKSNWEMISNCVEYIEQNEDRLSTGGMDNQSLTEGRVEIWEKARKSVRRERNRRREIRSLEETLLD